MDDFEIKVWKRERNLIFSVLGFSIVFHYFNFVFYDWYMISVWLVIHWNAYIISEFKHKGQFICLPFVRKKKKQQTNIKKKKNSTNSFCSFSLLADWTWFWADWGENIVEYLIVGAPGAAPKISNRRWEGATLMAVEAIWMWCSLRRVLSLSMK